MKVKFLKQVGDAKGKSFLKGKVYDLEKKRAENAISKNVAEKVESKSSTQKKISKKTVKK